MRRSLKGRVTESYSVSTGRERNAAGADAAAVACEYLWKGALRKTGLNNRLLLALLIK